MKEHQAVFHSLLITRYSLLYWLQSCFDLCAVRFEEWRDANGMLIFLTRVLALFLFGLYI